LANAAFAFLAAAVSADSFVRFRVTLVDGLFSSAAFAVFAAGSDPRAPPGGHDALEEECRRDLALAATPIGVKLVDGAKQIVPNEFAERLAQAVVDLENMVVSSLLLMDERCGYPALSEINHA
jgi:hypothetical protein